MFELSVKDHFSAAHSIAGYDGPCADLHGHNYMVEIFVSCKKLNKIGLAIDFKTLKALLREVLSGLDHANLNEHPAFKAKNSRQNPSAENLVRHIFGELKGKLNGSAAVLRKVAISETENTRVTYTEE